MKITPGIVHNVLRVYGTQLVADRKRREKIWIKKKKEGSISGGCDRSAPQGGIIDKYI